MNYAGHYINLDRQSDRRAAMEAEFAQHGLAGAYTRFEAADGNILNFPNPCLSEEQIGCFTSHYMLLKEHLDDGRYLHIVEDDIVLSSSAAPAIQWAIGQGHLEQYDIIYTDVFVPILNDAYKAYKKFYDTAVTRDEQGRITRVAFSVVDMQGLIFASTTSFLVNKKSVHKLHDLYAAELARGASMPIDLFIRKLCSEGTIKVGCVFPFVTSVRFDHIIKEGSNRPPHLLSSLAAHLARYSFFIGADFNLYNAYLEKYLPLPEPDAQTRCLNHLLAFSLTDKYQSS